MISKKVLIISFLYAVVNIHATVRETVHETDSFFLNLLPEIVQALTNGDAKALSNYFNTSVELIFSDNQNVYGKAQAEQILKNFFNRNASTGGKFIYKPLHNGIRDNAHYYIGELSTGRGSYRVTIYMKDQRIHLMKIESND